MPETPEPKTAKRDLITSFIGTVDPASLEDRTDKAGKAFVFAKLESSVNGKAVDLYVRGGAIEPFREKVAAGEQVFVQGTSLASGKALGVTSVEPKTYAIQIEAIKNGTNDYGDWAAVKASVEGMEKPKHILLEGADAARAVAAGVGNKMEFEGAWRANKNQQDNYWSSQLVGASVIASKAAAKTADAPAADEVPATDEPDPDELADEMEGTPFAPPAP